MMRHALFLLLAIALLLPAGCAGSAAPLEYTPVYGHTDLEDKELTIENEYLRLRFDCITTQITLINKATGKVWYSNPPEADRDAIAVKNIIEKLQSQLVITYGQTNGVVTEINNYALSNANNTFSWAPVENGVKVMYTVGKAEREYIMPKAMPESRFKAFYNMMNVDQQKALNNYYRIIDINNLKATDDMNALLEQYPDLKNERMFILRENLQVNIMDRLEGYYKSIGYTAEDYLRDMTSDKAGEQKASPVFNVSVIYRLDGPDFIVTVPLDEIEYRSAYPILTLTVLPFFGAGGQEDDGFMLVPDSAGAIIRFNNGKQDQAPYSNALYGYDYGLKRSALISDNAAYFPVFGINNNGESVICVVEDGAENTTFEADVSGRLDTYNSVNAKYTVFKWDDVDISKANIYAKVFERKELTGVFQQRYIFVNSPEWSDMAVAYRGYLLNRYPMLDKRRETCLPLVLSLVGAVDRTTNVMGVPVVEAYPLTTYSQAASIIDNFLDAGASSLRINYTGWFNGGVVHDTPANISLIPSLGGKQGFTGLLDYVNEKDIDLYFESDFTFIYNLSAFNGYRVNQDAARRLSRDLVRMYPYSFVWYGERTGSFGKRYTYYLAAPAYSMNAIDSFCTQLRNLGGANITFGSIGNSINSDFNVKHPVSRGMAIEMQQDKMAALSGDGAKLMIHGGNVYAVPFSDFIIDMELESKDFNILDESVPLYPMVLHGLIPYTGSPINLSPDYARGILKTVESGAGLQFLLMNADGEDLQGTNYTCYFSCGMGRWGDKAIGLYNRLNDELAHTASQYITRHQKLAPQAYLTVYEDGTEVIVNYSDDPFTYKGYEVKGVDFIVIR